jgi:transcriptional regulator with XRE-family HTH domain
MPTTNLGAFIRQTRKGKGISGRELSRRINVSAPALSEIERGIRNPSDAVLERIARSLGVEFEQLHALDSWSALKEFRDMIESDRDLSLSFVGVVRAINTGKVSRKALADKLLQMCHNSGR